MIPIVRLRPVNQSMDQLVHDFNTALDETGGSNSSSRSSASRRKVRRPFCVFKSYQNPFLCRPGRDDVRAPVISLSVTATTSVTTAAPVWTMLASCPGSIISISIDLRIDLPGWRGSTGDIPPMAGLYWRIYYQIENPRIGDLQWRSSTGGPPMAGYRICEG